MKNKENQSDVDSTASSRVGTESVGGRKGEPLQRRFSKSEQSDNDSREEDEDDRSVSPEAARR
jgi:hypothetical protein